MQAISFGVLAFGWALASWVYFDATERGERYPWVWALVVLFLGWTLIPWIIYLVDRNQSDHLEVADRAGLRQYLVTTSFTSMALTVAGASTALSAALVWAVPNQLSTTVFRDLLGSSMAAALIGAIIWLPHWRWLKRQLDAGIPDREFRALYALRRAELLTSAFLFGGVAAVTSLWVLGGAFSAVFHATYAGAAGWLPALGPALFCSGAAAYHAWYYRAAEASEQRQRFDRVPAPRLIHRAQRVTPTAPLPPTPRPGQAGVAPWQGPHTPVAATGPPRGREASWPATPPAWPPVGQSAAAASQRAAEASPTGPRTFCGKCATVAQAGDLFCRACGSQLGSPATHVA